MTLYDFFTQVEKLKKVQRYSGQEGLNESVADHGYRLTLMIQILGPENKVNTERCIKMGLVSLLDQYSGNIDARTGISPQEKSRREKEGLQELLIGASENLAADIRFDYQEYSAGQSRDAQFVKAVKDLETLMHITQAGHTTVTHPDMIPNYADKSVAKFPGLLGYLVEAKARLKKEFEKSRIEWHEEYDELIL